MNTIKYKQNLKLKNSKRYDINKIKNALKIKY